MNSLKLVECIAMLLTFLAMYYIAKKKTLAFPTFIIAQLLQIVIFINQSNYFLFVMMLGLISFNIYAWFEWSKKEIPK
jgi:nicotinamide riboside transporter PnuC